MSNNIDSDFLKIQARNWRLFSLSICAAVACLLFWWAYASWPTKKMRLTGVVLDATTQQPVPKAKVIVSVWNTILWGNGPWMFGILTDEHGQFGVEKTMKYRFNLIDLEICSPANRYTYYHSIMNKRNQRFFVGGSKQKGQWKPTHQEYSRFSKGQWSRDVAFRPYSSPK